MPGLGIWEIVFIMVLALLIFGPKKLPELGRTLGRGFGEFRRATNDLKRTFDAEMHEIDREPERNLAPPQTMARTAESSQEPAGESAESVESDPSIADAAAVESSAENAAEPDGTDTSKDPS